MDTYEQKYKKALERAKKLQETCDSTAVVGWCEYIFPELKESKDEKTRKRIIALVNAHGQGMYKDDMLTWLENIPYTIDREKREGFHLGYKAALEKQGESYTKKDVDDAYLKGISDAKNELEKQGEQKQYDIDVLEKHITKDSISELAHTVIVRNGWEIVDAKEQNPAWSEEDKRMFDYALDMIEWYGGKNEKRVRLVSDWLKSLKQRIGG